MNNDCPDCYGSASSGKTERCQTCEYKDSCEYFANSQASVSDRTSGQVCFENISYSAKVAQPAQQSDICSELSASDSDTGSVLKIMEFLLDVDNYTAELISAVLHGNCNTTADLGAKFGVSRQAIHRKIVDCCTEHPELRKLFYTRLYNCRRLLTDSTRLQRQKEKAAQRAMKNKNQMEFEF